MVHKYKNNDTLVAVNGHSGRQRKLTVRSARYVIRLVDQNPKKSAANLDNVVSETTGILLAFQLQPFLTHYIRQTCMEGWTRRNRLLKSKQKQARLQFGNNHEDKTLSFWDSVSWSDETKVNLFGSDDVQNVWRRPGEEYREKCLVPTIKHGGGSLMVWGCMSAHGVGELHFIDFITNPDMYCKF